VFIFVWEHEFDANLRRIEPCSVCAEYLRYRIECQYCKDAPNEAGGYGSVRLSWKSRWLLTVYVATGCMITMCSLQVDPL